MSLDKAIEHGKEFRKPYRGSETFDYSCRNHGGKTKKHCGGQCGWCLENRTHKYRKEAEKKKVNLEDLET